MVKCFHQFIYSFFYSTNQTKMFLLVVAKVVWISWTFTSVWCAWNCCSFKRAFNGFYDSFPNNFSTIKCYFSTVYQCISIGMSFRVVN